MSDISLYKGCCVVTLTDEDQCAEPNAQADYMAEGFRCYECKAPAGHSRTCSHYDGYTPEEYREHEADGDAIPPEEEG